MSDLSLFELAGKKALVTGGAMGVGRACATALAMGGADVAIVDLNEEVGQKTVETIKAKGCDAFFVQCDISDPQQVQDMTAAVVKRFGRLDIGVNNVGYGLAAGGSEGLVKSDWDGMIGVNLTGTFLCAQAQAQQMIKQTPTEGKIINTASIFGSIAGGNVAYNAAKAGVIHLTKTLAVEWGRFNINVNCFSPSYILSTTSADAPLWYRQRVRETTPMGYFQHAEDVYGPLLFLASRASNFVTGHNLIVDGGHTLNTWLTPLERDVPPRVSPEEEIVEVKKDLDALGVPYDQHGVKNLTQ